MFRDIVRGFENIEALQLCSCQVHYDPLRTPLLHQTSRLVKVFAEVFPKLKTLNLQVHPETFIELIEASPSVTLQLQELSITLDSSLYKNSERFYESLATLIARVSHSLTSLKLVVPYDNLHHLFPFLGRTRLPHLSKVWFGLHTRPPYNTVRNLDGLSMFLCNHAAQLEELHLSVYQRGMPSLPAPSLLEWYQRCFQDIPVGSKLKNLWLGSCDPRELVPLYTLVLGSVFLTLTSLLCVRAQLDFDQLEVLLSIPSCAQLRSLALYYKGVLNQQLAALFAEKCPELERLCIRYDRNTYKQEVGSQVLRYLDIVNLPNLTFRHPSRMCLMHNRGNRWERRTSGHTRYSLSGPRACI